ncbi:hypothetical protein P389DRAFT_211415 [Cystobasidium minutum MCA 4210]|uniref:uncharacterized protein n=1 Tax=Cystobasidium minutum MCA 4210 TaxID=1397322 RepID=UPI0034CED443|eukprot:jgi/Rhomi1/211415/estExt_Genemark1.C_4_t30094
MSSAPGTNSPPVEATSKNPLGETGQSKPISDAAQRGDQFNQDAAKDIESGQGGSDVDAAKSNAKETASAYASK